jgi:hypothetical protein
MKSKKVRPPRFLLTHGPDEIGMARSRDKATEMAHDLSVKNGWKVLVWDMKLWDAEKQRESLVMMWSPVPDLEIIVALWLANINHYNPLIN